MINRELIPYYNDYNVGAMAAYDYLCKKQKEKKVKSKKQFNRAMLLVGIVLGLTMGLSIVNICF